MVSTEMRLIIFFAAEDGEALHSQQKQDLELTVAQIMSWIAKFRLKLKEVRKTTRPLRYNLNQISYDYTVEATNRFKRLDLIDSMLEELWMEVHNIVQAKTSPRIRNARRQSGCLRRPYKYLRKEEQWTAKEKGKDIPKWMQSSTE